MQWNLPPRLPYRRIQGFAVAAYVAYVVRYVRGWLRSNRRELFRLRKPVWFLNLGMPAASYDDVDRAELYRRIGSAGLLLSDIGVPVSVEAAENFLENRHVVTAGASKEAAEELGVAIIPEAAAEMTAFAKSARGAPGLYFLVDIGAMTLDACMFRLNQPAQSGDAYAFMAAQVRPLGVDSLHWFLEEGKTEAGFIKQCNRTLRTVVWRTKRHRDRRAECWKQGRDVPVFLAWRWSSQSAAPRNRRLYWAMAEATRSQRGNSRLGDSAAFHSRTP